jgi:hypothetical protein
MVSNLHENLNALSISFHLKMFYKDQICDTCLKKNMNSKEKLQKPI